METACNTFHFDAIDTELLNVASASDDRPYSYSGPDMRVRALITVPLDAGIGTTATMTVSGATSGNTGFAVAKAEVVAGPLVELSWHWEKEGPAGSDSGGAVLGTVALGAPVLLTMDEGGPYTADVGACGNAGAVNGGGTGTIWERVSMIVENTMGALFTYIKIGHTA